MRMIDIAFGIQLNDMQGLNSGAVKRIPASSMRRSLSNPPLSIRSSSRSPAKTQRTRQTLTTTVCCDAEAHAVPGNHYDGHVIHDVQLADDVLNLTKCRDRIDARHMQLHGPDRRIRADRKLGREQVGYLHESNFRLAAPDLLLTAEMVGPAIALRGICPNPSDQDRINIVATRRFNDAFVKATPDIAKADTSKIF